MDWHAPLRFARNDGNAHKYSRWTENILHHSLPGPSEVTPDGIEIVDEFEFFGSGSFGERLFSD